MKQQNIKEPVMIPDDQDTVRLKPLFGIRPGVYLAALYGFIILLALFFLLFYPGLAEPGSMLEVSTVPRGAAVRIDDVFYDAAPARIFVPAGRHDVTIVMDGFEPFTTELKAGSRVFASKFFPKKIALSARLVESKPLAALKVGAADYAAWSFAGEPTLNYQVPLSLSEGVYRSAAKLDRETYKVLETAAGFMVTGAALKDLLRAEFLAINGGSAPSPLAALAALREIFAYIQKKPAFTVALAAILPAETAGVLIDASIYPEIWADGMPQNPAVSAPRSGQPINVAGIEFSAEFLANSYTQSGSFQHEEKIKPFYISLNEITFNQWQRFLAENPQWRLEEKQTLVEKGLVSDDYLEPFSSYDKPEDFFEQYPQYPAPAMSGISWYAAGAFCSWLNTKLPAALAQGYEARLPTEAEWEYAAIFAENAAPDITAPRRMTLRLAGRSGVVLDSAGLWEWCADYYIPLNYLGVSNEAAAMFEVPERSVRGGSWANQQGTVAAQTRASLPAGACSAWTGFRVVIAAKDSLSTGK